MSDLELCPVCKVGPLKPTGKFSVSGYNTEPFRETDSMRKLQCDNPDCGTNRTNIGVIEKEIKVDGIVSAEVTKAADVERMRKNLRLCTSCGKETQIVFSKDNARFCQECWDNLRQPPSEL